MNEGYVRTAVDERIATITFHHPKGNSLPTTLLRELARQIEKAGHDEAVRVIVLQSEGEKAFCAGASFDELTAIDSEEKGLIFFNGFAQVINAIRNANCFVIGRIHARTVGGGVGIAAATDICYAHESAGLRMSELAIGIGPFVVGPAVERRVGNAAFGLMCTTPATWRSAEWAQQHGLYAETFTKHEVMDSAIREHAQELSCYSLPAMTELKKILWRGTEDWDTLLPQRAAISGRLVLSEFTSRAIAAFKRKASQR